MRDHPGFSARSAVAFGGIAYLPNDDLTPDVSFANRYYCATGHTAARSITNFINGVIGQILIIKGANPTYKTTLVDGTYLKLNGNWVEASNNMIMLINFSDVWYELCRSANA